MHALVLESKETGIVYKKVEKPTIEDGEVLVKIQAAALNHRDVWITKGQYAGIKYPTILGSDGTGIVVAGSMGWKGQEVIINPSQNWGDNPRFQAADYQILGLPTDGTFAEYVKVQSCDIVPKPDHLTAAQAAALPLGGLTAYRALFTKANLQKGEKVLISGVGGGVALFAFQFAIAAGAEVYVTSGSQEKIDLAISMGAKGGKSYKEEKWGRAWYKEHGGFDVIIDSAGGSGFNELIEAAAFGGRIAMYGATRGMITNADPRKIFWKQLSILGSTMGNGKEFAQMVDFVCQNEVIPVVDSVFDLKDGRTAFDRMDKGLQFGKIVLTV